MDARKAPLLGDDTAGVVVPAVSLGAPDDDEAPPFATLLRLVGELSDCAATSSGEAIVTSTFEEPLKIVTKDNARSTSAGGIPSTSASSLTCANSPCRGEYVSPAAL